MCGRSCWPLGAVGHASFLQRVVEKLWPQDCGVGGLVGTAGVGDVRRGVNCRTGTTGKQAARLQETDTEEATHAARTVHRKNQGH